MKRLLNSLFLLLLIFFSVAPLFPAHAQEPFTKPCLGPSSYAADVPTIQGLECLVANVLASAITVIGIVAFVMFLIGGFQVLTAGANAKGMEQGKNSISFAVLGIVLALASFLILNVIANLTGIKTILQFNTQLENVSKTPAQ